MLRMRVLTLAVLLFAACPTADARTPGPRTVILVRHGEAEPESVGPDRKLTEKGRDRAAELARVLGETAPRAVYSTHFPRSRATAEPLAHRVGVDVTIIDDTPAILSALAAQPRGSTVVVVGHSNTLPALLAGLTGVQFPAGEKVGFDGMWIVSLDDAGVSTLRLRYGPTD
jgi:broad specificity phosphatase PhoE